MIPVSSPESPLEPLSSPALPSPSSESLHTLSPHTTTHAGEIDLLRFHSPVHTSTAPPSLTAAASNPSLLITPPSSSSYPSNDSQAGTTPTSVRLLENFRPSQHPPLPPPAIAILSPEETAVHNHNSIAPQPVRDTNGNIITEISVDPPTELTPNSSVLLTLSAISASDLNSDPSSGTSSASHGVSLSAPPPSSATVKTVGRFSVVEQEGSPGSARTNNSNLSVSPDPNTPYEVRGNDCKLESINPNDPHANSLLQSIVEEGAKNQRKVAYKDGSTGAEGSDSDSSSSDESDDSTGSGSRSPKIPLTSLQMLLSPADSLKSLPQAAQLRPNSIKATRSGRFSVVEFQERLTPTRTESSASGSSFQARLASPAIQPPLSRMNSSPSGPRSHQTIYESLSQLNADFGDIMNENEVLNYESRLLLSHVFLLRTKLEAALMGQLAIDTAQEALRVTDITQLHCFKKLQQEQILLQQQAILSSSASNQSSISTSVTGVIQPNLSIAVSPSPDPVNTSSYPNPPQSTRSAAGVGGQNQVASNLPPTLHPSNSSPAAMTGGMGSPPPNPPNSTRDSSKAQLHPSAQQLQHQLPAPQSTSMPNLTPSPAVVSKFFADQQAVQQQQQLQHSQASPVNPAIEGEPSHDAATGVANGTHSLTASASTPALSSVAASGNAQHPHPHHHHAITSAKHVNLKIDKVRHAPPSKDPLSPGSGKSKSNGLHHSNSSHQLAPPSHTTSSAGSQSTDRLRSSPVPSPSPRHSPTPRTPRAPKPSPHHTSKVIHSHTHTHNAHVTHAHHHVAQPHGHHAHTHHGVHSHAKGSAGGQLISPPESLERGHSHGDRSTPSGGSSPSVSGNHSHLKSPNTPGRPRKNTPNPPVPQHPTSNSHANKNANKQPLPQTSTKANHSAVASTASTASSTPDILEQLANKCIENI